MSSSPAVITPAEPSDIPALTELAARTFPLACPPDLPESSIRAFIDANLSPDAFRGFLDAVDHHVLVARTGLCRTRQSQPGTIVGYALLVDDAAHVNDPAYSPDAAAPSTYISKFYVDPASQGTGVADALMAAVTAHARTRHHRSMWLGTNERNARAQRFYERSGFRAVGTRQFVVGGVRCTDLVYARELGWGPSA